MKLNLVTLPKSMSLILIVLLAFSLSAIFLTGCGSTKAAEEKAKAKKKKAAAREEAEEEEESAEKEPEKEPEKSDSNTSKESETAKPDATKTEKKSEKNAKDEKVEKSAKENAPSGEEIWTDLIKGNKRFMSGKHTVPQLATMRQGLVAGQKPKAIILGCADSRVPPELLFDRNLGEIFVVRDAGNVADEVTLGSIEYAVEHLHANLVVILGHESCGAVAAAVSGEEMPTRNLKAIVDHIIPSFEGSTTCPLGGKSNLDCVKLNVQHSAEDIIKQSPIIKKAVKEGLTVVRAFYKLDTGEVTRLN